ncbi:MAG: tRNA (adenosine(37)-N6)-dimethylallyltransferase MiaA [Deltaproteobacteria bacterium]|nr:tRNA (adenosine(37)-N6)-dimethylallyltransferase MiaA [Deltaproteobacteria bacterium]
MSTGLEEGFRIVVVCGPTAVGKSAIAVELAKRLNGEIISADSRQVYRGMDIGTGKITEAEMQGVRHHLIDVASPRRTYTVTKFVRDADRAICSIVRRGKVPIVCGGTGFYIDALLRRTIPAPVAPNLRLRKKFSTLSADELFELLRQRDQSRAQMIDPHNKVRLIRALEIIDALGAVPRREKKKSPYEALRIGITLPRDDLRANIAQRLHWRLDQGLVEEVERLRNEGISDTRLNLLGLEYRETLRCLQGGVSKTMFNQQLTTAIWKYAKRQLTWFRRDTGITWFAPGDVDAMEKHLTAYFSSGRYAGRR